MSDIDRVYRDTIENIRKNAIYEEEALKNQKLDKSRLQQKRLYIFAKMMREIEGVKIFHKALKKANL